MHSNKLSHIDWRKLSRKFQRKRKRRLGAQLKDEDLKKRQQSPSYQLQLAEENAAELLLLDAIRQSNEIENIKWEEAELRIEEKWRKQQLKQKEFDRICEAERKHIQDEFEAEQKRVNDAIEAKKRHAEEEQRLRADLHQRIQEFINCDGSVPFELLTNAETNPTKEICPYFAKAATCRFGHKCVRNHIRPGISNVLLIPSFFNSIHLELSKTTEYGSNLTLECDDTDLVDEFREFFRDVLLEFQKFGCIEYFVVCQNYAPHLRGNVYVEYSTERDALRAQQTMNSRYYAGRQINIEFCRISWKEAVCGLSLKGACSKGRNCNFLHLFKNPLGQYSLNTKIKRSAAIRKKLNVKNSWDLHETTPQRNWRWSESPPSKETTSNDNSDTRKLALIAHTKSKKSEKRRSQSRSKHEKKCESSRSRGRSQSRDRGRGRGHSRKRHRSRSRSHLKKNRRKSSRDRSAEHKVRKKKKKEKHKKSKKE